LPGYLGNVDIEGNGANAAVPLQLDGRLLLLEDVSDAPTPSPTAAATTTAAPTAAPTNNGSDPCGVYLCGANCRTPCGWSTPDASCVTGGFTTADEVGLGACGATNATTTTSPRVTVPSGGAAVEFALRWITITKGDEVDVVIAEPHVVSFGPGETAKDVNFSAVDAGLLEGPESFNVSE